MMDQLHIKSLRPGPSGDEKAPDHANTDEARGQSVPRLARYPDPEERREGHHRRPVVAAAPARDRRGPGARNVWPGARRYAEGDVDGRCLRNRICQLQARLGHRPDRPCRQFRLPGHRRRHEDDADPAAGCKRAGAGAGHVRPGQVPAADAAAGRRPGQDQRRAQGRTGGPRSVAGRYLRPLSGLPDRHHHSLSAAAGFDARRTHPDPGRRRLGAWPCSTPIRSRPTTGQG